MKRRQKGAILFIVLAIMSALILLAANFAITMSRSSSMLTNLTDGVQARYSALSGIQYAMFAVQDGDKETRWTTDGKLHEITLGESKIWLSVSSASNRIDINSSDKEMFIEVLKNLGIDEAESTKVAANILHWRNFSDDSKDEDAATDADYESAGLRKPAHRRFLVPEEIGSVLGVTSDIYTKLMPIITVYGGGRVDALTAPDNVLSALGLESGEIDTLKSARQAYYDSGIEIPADALFENPYLEISRRSQYYRVLSHALLYGDTPSTQYAIIGTRREKDGSFVVIESAALTGEDKSGFLARVEHTKNTSEEN